MRFNQTEAMSNGSQTPLIPCGGYQLWRVQHYLLFAWDLKTKFISCHSPTTHIYMHLYSDPLFNESFIFQLWVQSASWFHQRQNLIFLFLISLFLCHLSVSISLSLSPHPHLSNICIVAQKDLCSHILPRKSQEVQYYVVSKKRLKEKLSATVSTLSFSVSFVLNFMTNFVASFWSLTQCEQ